VTHKDNHFDEIIIEITISHWLHTIRDIIAKHRLLKIGQIDSHYLHVLMYQQAFII